MSRNASPATQELREILCDTLVLADIDSSLVVSKLAVKSRDTVVPGSPVTDTP